jgi:hypothetical protein
MEGAVSTLELGKRRYAEAFIAHNDDDGDDDDDDDLLPCANRIIESGIMTWAGQVALIVKKSMIKKMSA